MLQIKETDTKNAIYTLCLTRFISLFSPSKKKIQHFLYKIVILNGKAWAEYPAPNTISTFPCPASSHADMVVLCTCYGDRNTWCFCGFLFQTSFWIPLLLLFLLTRCFSQDQKQAKEIKYLLSRRLWQKGLRRKQINGKPENKSSGLSK